MCDRRNWFFRYTVHPIVLPNHIVGVEIFHRLRLKTLRTINIFTYTFIQIRPVVAETFESGQKYSLS